MNDLIASYDKEVVLENGSPRDYDISDRLIEHEQNQLIDKVSPTMLFSEEIDICLKSRETTIAYFFIYDH